MIVYEENLHLIHLRVILNPKIVDDEPLAFHGVLAQYSSNGNPFSENLAIPKHLEKIRHIKEFLVFGYSCDRVK